MTFRGKKHSEESKQKTRLSLLGKKHSPERIERIRAGLLGPNNPWRGRHHSKETKEKMSRAVISERRYNWTGDNVGYKALHKWIRTHLLEPEQCQNCDRKTDLDLSNITGEYSRDFINWKYYCRLCHNRFDRARQKHK